MPGLRSFFLFPLLPCLLFFRLYPFSLPYLRSKAKIIPHQDRLRILTNGQCCKVVGRWGREETFLGCRFGSELRQILQLQKKPVSEFQRPDRTQVSTALRQSDFPLSDFQFLTWLNGQWFPILESFCKGRWCACGLWKIVGKVNTESFTVNTQKSHTNEK